MIRKVLEDFFCEVHTIKNVEIENWTLIKVQICFRVHDKKVQLFITAYWDYPKNCVYEMIFHGSHWAQRAKIAEKVHKPPLVNFDQLFSSCTVSLKIYQVQFFCDFCELSYSVQTFQFWYVLHVLYLRVLLYEWRHGCYLCQILLFSWCGVLCYSPRSEILEEPWIS